jgi:hypothetical protein
MKAKLVWVKVQEGKSGLFFATSPELRGFLVAEPTIDALYKAIPEAITNLYAACGEHVIVEQAEKLEDDLTPWVAFPAAIARKALEAHDTTNH